MPKVLIVEDELMIADYLEETLTDAGYKVCGIASTMAAAAELNDRHRPELGIIDLHLFRVESGTEIAAVLRKRGSFGVLYATGNPHHELLSQAQGDACISKPYLPYDIISALHIISERMSNRPLSAFPRLQAA